MNRLPSLLAAAEESLTTRQGGEVWTVGHSSEILDLGLLHIVWRARCHARCDSPFPGLSLAGVRLVIADHALGLPVLRTLSLCTCCRHYPGAAAGRTVSLTFTQPCQPSPKGSSGRPAHRPFRGLLGVHSRYGCTLALSPIRDTHCEGFSYFVTSIAAPAASGWSVRRGRDRGTARATLGEGLAVSAFPRYVPV